MLLVFPSRQRFTVHTAWALRSPTVTACTLAGCPCSSCIVTIPTAGAGMREKLEKHLGSCACMPHVECRVLTLICFDCAYAIAHFVPSFRLSTVTHHSPILTLSIACTNDCTPLSRMSINCNTFSLHPANMFVLSPQNCCVP